MNTNSQNANPDTPRHQPLFSLLYQRGMEDVINEMSKRLHGHGLSAEQKQQLRDKAAQVMAA